MFDDANENRHSYEAPTIKQERLNGRRQNRGAETVVADGNPAFVTAPRQAYTLALARGPKLAGIVSTEPNSCSSCRQISAPHPPSPIVAQMTPVANDAVTPAVVKVRANAGSYLSTRQRRTNAARPATIAAAVSIDGYCGARRRPNPFQSNSISSERHGLPGSARASICASDQSTRLKGYPLNARPLETFCTTVNVQNDRVKGVAVEHRRRGSA